MSKKYIFITGGVVSSLGKGIAAASIGKLMETRGLKVSLIKCDPYINVDPGTLNPYQHGEVYVTEDGAETDLDLGHYERFTNAKLSKANNITTGKIYYSVITKERKGEYLGKTVQIIPHITDKIKSSIRNATKDKKIDIVIVEIGGTVGDIESLPFLESIRQLKIEEKQRAINIHVTLLPFIKTAGEIKTKPTQHSVGRLREIGIMPDIILCRTSKHLTSENKNKIALFCNVEKKAVIPAIDVKETIYEIPLIYKNENLDKLILEKLHLKFRDKKLKEWQQLVNKFKLATETLNIAVVGKYISLQDAYKSIYEALDHGAIANNVKLKIKKIESEDLKNINSANLKGIQGILVPGGFGARGIKGKIKVIKYARENNIPFFGICLGMQTAVIEFARNVCNFKNANSTEFSKKTKYPVIHLLLEQKKISNKGATMRLGAYKCNLKKNTKAYSAYKKDQIYERHRHRYEFNNKYRKFFEKKGMIVSGLYAKKNLVEILELKHHPWFLSVQFHPEFKSKPNKPHPLFKSFIEACKNHKKGKTYAR